MDQRDESGKLNRRDFFELGVAGMVGLTLAGIPELSQGAETKAAADEVIMMFPGNYTWSAAVRGAIGSSIGGGGEIGEIYKVCAALKGRSGDNAAWFEEWNKMAEKVALLGDQAKDKGYLQTASAAYMRAAFYIQVGERLRQPRTPGTQKAYARSIELFKKGLPDVPFLSVESVEIPFEGGKSLPAYFVKQRGTPAVKWPTVVFFDGLDITKEIQYFRVPDLAKRGMACLIVDGPGNGESIRFRGMTARYDSNVAGSAAVDYLERREDVDKDRIAVMGVSLGGYFAPRCAAFEKRFKACVAWGAIYDWHARFKIRLEKAFKGASLSVPAEHYAWFFGVDSMEEVLKRTEPFTIKGVAGKIECPFLLTHGEADAQVPLEDAHKLFAEVGSKDKTLKIFTREEGGAEHCQGDNLTIGIAYIGDWLSDRLKTH
jgi:alpha-beta hydrolase superfamily lysophospholipase